MLVPLINELVYILTVSCLFKTQENSSNIFVLLRRLEINGLLKVDRKCKSHASQTPFNENAWYYVERKNLTILWELDFYFLGGKRELIFFFGLIYKQSYRLL